MCAGCMVLSSAAAVALVASFLGLSWLVPTLVCAAPCRRPPRTPTEKSSALRSAASDPLLLADEIDVVAVSPMRFWALFVYWYRCPPLPPATWALVLPTSDTSASVAPRVPTVAAI